MALAPLILSLVGAAAVALSWTYGFWSFGSPGAGLMPAAAGVLVICASAADLRQVSQTPVALSRRLLAHAAALMVLPFASLVLGMLVAMAAYLVVVLYVIERLRLRNALLIAALTTTGCYLLFEKLLSVPLPKPMFL